MGDGGVPVGDVAVAVGVAPFVPPGRDVVGVEEEDESCVGVAPTVTVLPGVSCVVTLSIVGVVTEDSPRADVRDACWLCGCEMNRINPVTSPMSTAVVMIALTIRPRLTLDISFPSFSTNASMARMKHAR